MNQLPIYVNIPPPALSLEVCWLLLDSCASAKAGPSFLLLNESLLSQFPNYPGNVLLVPSFVSLDLGTRLTSIWIKIVFLADFGVGSLVQELDGTGRPREGFVSSAS